MSGDENAFPGIRSSGGEYADSPVTSVWSEGGLTKRELFAAMAMQGLVKALSNPYKFPYETAAAMSCKAADALIAALAKGPDNVEA